MAGLTALRERKILDMILLHLAGDEKGFTIKEKNEEDPLAPRSIFVSQPSDTLRSILNFAVVAERFAKDYLDFAIVNEYRRHNTKQDRKHNKRLSDWYQDYNAANRPLAALPEEILDKILGLLTTKPGHLLPITDRASLSVDSFSSTAAPSPEDSNQIKIFRLVCHRFAKLGLRRLFVRVRIRFSSEGFSTLREIAQRQDFRGTVKQFSYMIPRFYPPDGRTLEAKLEEVRANVEENKRKLALRAQGRVAQDRQQPTAQELRIALRRGEAEEEQLTIALGKAKQQREIIEQEIDVKTLVYALTNFKNLQQIRLMKVVDFHDKWEKYLSAHADVATEFRPFEWSYAYEHAARTLAFAIQESNSGVDRFSSRFMDPHTPILVTQELRRTISSIAERAIVLEFEFRQTDALVSLEQKMLQLSGLFQIGFKAAVENLRFLHIGFTRPVSIPLVDIFHNIHLKRLEHIGLHNWQMQGEELLDLLKRHKNTLKSLRLRHVLLRRNSNCSWRHVLQFVRSEIRLPQNGYVSLRWIDYEDDDIHAADGMNFLNGHAQINAISDEDSDEDSVLNDMSDAWSESTDEIEEDEASDESESNTVVGDHNEEDELDELDDSTDESHESLESHDEEDDLTRIFPTISIVETEPLPCGCANGTRWDDLDDDGNAVTRAQWSRWQKWVIKHCSKCDPSIAEDS